jgi:alkane 1-monooxygenase
MRMLALIYPLALVASIAVGGLWCWSLLALNIVAVPLADHTVRRLAPDWQPSAALLRRLFAPQAFAAYALAQFGALGFAVFSAAQGGRTPLEMFGLISATGIMTGTAGITAAHELIHRRSRTERALGVALLGMTSYMHFRIQHVTGHHREVGTEADPGTARPGESFPAYLSRAMASGAVRAWQLEVARLQRRGLHSVSLHNRMAWYAAAQAAILASLAAAFGWGAAAFFLAQSFVAVHLLEAVNYVQHYGLSRQPDRSGRPVPVQAAHAWDSDFRVSELLIFNLSRHAAHHLDAAIPCHRLRVLRDSPKLPYSFFLMVFLALLPPVWRLLMDPRVRALRQPPASTHTPLIADRLIHLDHSGACK